MIPDFESNRKFIENEFSEAKYDDKSGLDTAAFKEGLCKFYEENGQLPSPILRAKGIAYVLDNGRIEINPHQIYAGKIDTGVEYQNFASADIFQKYIFEKRRHRILSENIADNYDRACLGRTLGIGMPYTDFWHTVPDWNRIIRLGFKGFIDEANDYIHGLGDSEEDIKKRDFYRSVVICFEAAIRFLKRLYKASLAYEISEYSDCIEALCHRPPETTYELFNYIIIFLYIYEIGCERARSLGPVDRLWKQFIENDIKSGRYSRDEICELIRYFFIHFTATKRFAEQPIQIGGRDESGNTYCNDITRLILEVYDGMDIYDPKIHVRVHKGFPEDIFEKLLDMIRRGHSSICLLNDEIIIPGMMGTGATVSDATQYVALGCYEPIVMGKEEAEIGAAWLNLAKPLEFAVHSGIDVLTETEYGVKTPTDFECFEDFFDAFIIQLDSIIDFTVESCKLQNRYATLINPTPIYSATMEECMKNGKDVHEHPLTYNNISLKFFSLATVVDSMVAIKKFVFDQKLVTFTEIRQILSNNWEGHEILRLKIRRDREKYGNGLDLPDEITQRIVSHITDKLDKTETFRGGKFRVGLDSITNCVHDGQKTGATPDGRRAGEPTSKNLCASEGMDREGITALMNTLLKLDHTKLVNSAILDFILHPSTVRGNEGLTAFKTLVGTYFEKGGFGVQGNIVNREMLIDAKINPDKYKNLQVRLCGWNEHYVKLSGTLQDKFIDQLTEV